MIKTSEHIGGHVPVLLEPVIDNFLMLEKVYKASGRNYFIDMTFGLGGHSAALLEKYEWLKIIALDADLKTCEMGLSKYQNHVASGRLQIIKGNFSTFETLIPEPILKSSLGAIADFGISNFQLLAPGRGFSFDDSESLDMRIDNVSGSETAEEVLNTYSQGELADIFYHLGDERLSREISSAVIKRRSASRIKSCSEFAEIVRSVYKRHPSIRMEIDFATKAVMALRIFVNDEFKNIEEMLKKTPVFFPSGSMLFMISFHSNEDRRVKEFIVDQSKDCVCPTSIPVCRCDHRARVRSVTRKPLTASDVEMRANPRSRSAKMRIYEII